MATQVGNALKIESVKISARAGLTSLPCYTISQVNGGNMSSINIRNVPDDLHLEAKIAAMKGGKAFRDWMMEAMKEKLAREQDSK